MFNQFQTELYQRLQNFELDDRSHEFGFTRHLIKNHGWTERYAYRAIAEYKKFAFLTVVANHQIVPSDAVDSVWHAHLLQTQSYWSIFCPQILGKQLHHHPARGGKEERAEFHKLYLQTIASYQQYFGKPPIDIWSYPEIRFNKELKMQRISTVDNWIFPKNRLVKNIKRLALILGTAFLVLAMITAQQSLTLAATQDQSNLSFLGNWYYLLISISIGLVIRHQIRQPSTQAQKPLLNEYEVAYLAGGKKRAVELAITRLVDQGYLKPNVRHRTFAITKAHKEEINFLEHQVMKRVRQTPEFKKLKDVYGYETEDLRTQLVQYKLLSKLYPFVFLSYIIILILCFSQFDGKALLENQVASFWCVNLVAVTCLTIPGLRTYWGDRVLEDIVRSQNSFDPIKRFALYGKSVLSGGALDDLKQIYEAQRQADIEESSGCGC